MTPYTDFDGPGFFTFKLHARKSSYTFSARTETDANDWILNLQDAIDTCPAIQTITERLVLEIIVRIFIIFGHWDFILHH